MNYADKIFSEHIKKIIDEGVWSENARPHYPDGTVSNSKYITDVKMKFDLSAGQFPISTLRESRIKLAIEEILWIYQDQTSDLSVLEERGVKWWGPWALEDGTIGERYGKTVANYKIIDRVLEGFEKNPWNRRSIINLWQYTDLDVPAKLPPCAFQMIFDVRRGPINDGGDPFVKPSDEQLSKAPIYLDAALVQRSSDFLVAGLGINQMQYVALQMAVAKHLGFEVGTFSWNVMNLHIYDRHFEQAQELLRRYESGVGATGSGASGSSAGGGSEIKFYLDRPAKTNFYDILGTDFKLEGYEAIGPQLKFELAE
ncbi:MAG: thymidylate synthase [Bifidobacteriaceae bacterium]|jgi:thymidylate synthase|nr:thymidylate synthase [Bifidobacteriaceae bacterium]